MSLICFMHSCAVPAPEGHHTQGFEIKQWSAFYCELHTWIIIHVTSPSDTSIDGIPEISWIPQSSSVGLHKEGQLVTVLGSMCF